MSGAPVGENIIWGSEEEDEFPEVDFNEVLNILIESGFQVSKKLKKERTDDETPLTLIREERILRILAQSVVDAAKAKTIKEEDIRKVLDEHQMSLQRDAHDYVKIIEMAYPEGDFSSKEIREMAKKFKQVPVYKKIREQILLGGSYDVSKIKNAETR